MLAFSIDNSPKNNPLLRICDIRNKKAYTTLGIHTFIPALLGKKSVPM